MISKPNRSFNYVEVAILVTLSTKNLHGYALAQKVSAFTFFGSKEQSEAPKKVTSVYSQLRKMEKLGVVASSWEIVANEKPKRVYSITSDGRNKLGELMVDVSHLVASLLELLEQYRSGM